MRLAAGPCARFEAPPAGEILSLKWERIFRPVADPMPDVVFNPLISLRKLLERGRAWNLRKQRL